ncbi:MAG: GNAT family N-acetyltransferase, partial [Gammaproteobacteria bacterium]|nr:GNAT family N-acetyltransferase [Gammaproteobacteria bacterium]
SPMVSDLISEVSGLKSYTAQWADLAGNAAEPNPFYEPWALIPAIEYLDADRVKILFVWSDETRQLLLGVFPLQLTDRYRGLPIKRTVLWKHDYCYLCTPLIRSGYVQATLKAGLEAMDSHGELSSFALFSWLPAKGPVSECLQSDTLPGWQNKGVNQRFSRAFLSLDGDYETDFLSSIRKKQRKEWERTRRRLEEMGDVDVIIVDQAWSEESVSRMLDEFLQLENSGWKHEGGTAMQCNPDHASYFKTMMTEGIRQGQALLVQIRLNDEMVAAVTAIISAGRDVEYTVKMASAEEHQQLSLGTQAMLELTRHAYTLDGVTAIDSCAAEEHPMINRLWRDKKEMINLNSTRKNNPLNLVIPMTDLAIALAKKMSPQT